MASFEEIGHRVEQRLEELLEESARLRAALEALGGDGAPANRGLHAGRTTKPVVETLSRNRPVKPRGGSAVTPAEPNAVDGNDATRDLRWNAPSANCAKSLPRACATDRSGVRDALREARLGASDRCIVPTRGGCG